METSDVRRRLRQSLEQARKASADRRARADAARAAYGAFLRDVATPVFRLVANVAKAEGHPCTVFTPAEAVRLATERNAEDYIEMWLDASLDPPQVATRVSRRRGRDVTSTEGLLRAGASVGGLTDEDVLVFLLAEFGSLVER
jgi:hypothetical protein